MAHPAEEPKQTPVAHGGTRCSRESRRPARRKRGHGRPQEAFERAEKATEDGVSARELEILLLVARGLSNRRIAHSLTLAEATIKRHLANLYPKVGVGSRGEATRKALSEGWISTRDVTSAG